MPDFAYLGGEQGKGQLESALTAPRQTWGGVYLSRTVFDKTAVLFRSVIKNHPLVDGNKRLGLTCAFVFLLANGYFFWMPRAEAVAFAVDVAEGSLDAAEIARRLRRGAVKISWLRGASLAERRRYYEHIAVAQRLLQQFERVRPALTATAL